MTPTIGTRFGAYELLAPLDAGGLGEIHRARDMHQGRDVALWILSFEALGDDTRARLDQAAQATAAVRHPSILAVLEVGEQDDMLYLVTELLEGQTLRERLARSSVPPRRATGYALQLAQGLAAAHEHGLAHGNLSPEHVFLNRDGTLKILHSALGGRRGKAAGKRPRGTDKEEGAGIYTAPEQLCGLPADARSDVFAAGAILHEMLSGRNPFARHSASANMRAILEEEPPDLIETGFRVPPVLARIVRRCLAKDPAERFQSADDLAFALEAVSWPEHVPPAILDESSGVYIPERRRLGTILAGCILTAGMVVVTFAIGQSVGGRQAPSYEQVTFRRGVIPAARFWPEHRGIVYSAAWEGAPLQVQETRPGTRESVALGLPGASLLAVARSGELAIVRAARFHDGSALRGSLARVPQGSKSPRDLLKNVDWADWDPASDRLAVVLSTNGRDRLEWPPGQILYESTGRISHPRISPAGEQVAFFDHPDRESERGSLAVVDLKGRSHTLSSGWLRATGLAWSPGGDEVWFTGSQDDTSTSLSAATVAGRVRLLSRSPGRLVLHDVGSDGRVLLARETLRQEILWIAPGSSRARALGWFDAPRVRDLSADGRVLLFDDRDSVDPTARAVYLRRLEGSDPVRLRPGTALALSRDGKWALSVTAAAPPQLVLLPTAAGQPRSLVSHGFRSYHGAAFFPDGKRILFAAAEAGRGVRLYTQELTGSPPEPLTPEGVYAGALAPDGRTVAAIDFSEHLGVYTLGSRQPRAIPGLAPGHSPIGWADQGRVLLVTRLGEIPAVVSKVEIATGQKTVWQDLQPADPAGAVRISDIHVTPDLKSYAYTCERIQSDLYVVEGLR